MNRAAISISRLREAGFVPGTEVTNCRPATVLSQVVLELLETLCTKDALDGTCLRGRAGAAKGQEQRAQRLAAPLVRV